jgi:myo-inositol catabolism protein IolC
MGKKTYLLCNIPEDFWRKIKIMVAERDRTIRGIILELLKKEYEEYEISKK